MIEMIIFLAIILIALIIVLFNKDSSFAGFVLLIGSCIVSFAIAYYFESLFLIVIFSAVLGLIVSYMGYDEIVKGRKWLYILAIGGFALEIIEFSMGNKIEGFWLASVSLMSFVGIVLSYNKRFLSVCRKNNKI